MTTKHAPFRNYNRPNLLIANRFEVGEKYAEAFCLDPDKWCIAGHGMALTGRVYEKIVIITPPIHNHLQADRMNQYIKSVNTHVKHNGQFIVI